jgi:membrane protein
MVTASPKLHLDPIGFWSRFSTLVRVAAAGTYKDGCFGIAKGAAYSALLAFFPILTTSAALLLQANAAAVARTITRLLSNVIPPGTEGVVRALFAAPQHRPVLLLIVSVVVAIWAGSGVMLSMMEGFRSIYRIPQGRPLLQERGIAMLLVVIAALPMLGASVLIVFGNRARQLALIWLKPGGRELQGWVQLMGQLANLGIAIGAIMIATALVYYFGPNRKQSFVHVLPGAALATVLWLLSTLAVGWYIRNITNFNVLYGSVGAGLALLVWSYVLALITLFGCEFNAARENAV